MNNKIRVLLADDSALARGLLRSYLEEDGGFELVGEAADGMEAVMMAQDLRPDLITMDLEMPRMGGLEAIREIMASCATPILVVSNVADARNAYDAVALGALDVVRKPTTDTSDRAEFVSKARLVSGVKVITHVRAQRVPLQLHLTLSQEVEPDVLRPVSDPVCCGRPSKLVVIASSTGGPQALAKILSELPADFPAPILIAQHIALGFAVGMAEWLASLCVLPVQMGHEGMPLCAGVVTIAPSEFHMSIDPDFRLRLKPHQDGDIYRPSCDVLMASAAQVLGERCIGIVLTGMGRDGLRGIQAIRDAGGRTLAQDEASSVIYGMNALAIDSGAVQQVLSLERMAAMINKLAREVK